MHQRRVACSRLLAQVAALCLPALACTEPRFARDAAAEPDAAQEARADTHDLIDPRWAPWVGRYAARTILYAVDGPLRPTGEELSLVAIEPRGDKLVLAQQLCLYEGGWEFLLQGNIRYRYPESVALETELMATRRSFETLPSRLRLGFDADAPAACAPGGTAPSDQPWHHGECSCPEGASALPADARDCRVTDPDDDGKPGVTFDAAISGARLAYHAAQAVEVRYLNGYRIDDRLYAYAESSVASAVFSCTRPDINGCMVGDATPCAPEFNKAVFIPLPDDDYDCDRIVSERAGLFPEPIPPFPSACANTP
jgi:hypothetical protein